MRKIFLRAFCLVFVLTLCLPMVACDLSNMQFGGLVGELMAGNNIEGEETLGQIYDDVIIEDILPDIEIETAIDTNWDEVFTGDIYTEMPTEDITYDDVIGFPTEEIQTTEPPIVDCIIPEPVLHFAFDECDAWIGDTQVQQFFTPGQHASWDCRAVIEDYYTEYVRIWGWVAFVSEQIEIGYQIDYTEPVFDDAFMIEAEQPIIDAALFIGAHSASRIGVMIPVDTLSGSHTIQIVARDEFGNQQQLVSFNLEKPAYPDNAIEIPTDTWAVTGHVPHVVGADDPSFGPMLVAGGIEQGALLHQGSVGIGEFDLSQYEKMIVFYGIDNSEFSVENYNNNPNNRIMITSTELNMVHSPEESAIIASTVYTLRGWQVTPIEIDLTGVDYSGAVHVTYDTLPGTFMVIGAIYLVPYSE
ncbi:MAG: hypothetical protein IIX86_06110 [Clostridia bacterium]|nr:hypothetical protein [Clostridia bacterium]